MPGIVNESHTRAGKPRHYCRELRMWGGTSIPSVRHLLRAGQFPQWQFGQIAGRGGERLTNSRNGERAATPNEGEEYACGFARLHAAASIAATSRSTAIPTAISSAVMQSGGQKRIPALPHGKSNSP